MRNKEQSGPRIYLGRGYDDDFQEHMKNSMESSLNTNKILHIIQGSASNTEKLERIIKSGGVYAWAARDEHKDVVDKMSPGDWFLLRGSGNNPNNRIFRHLLKIDVTWMTGGPQYRSEIASEVWNDERYRNIWFGSEIHRLNLSERKLNELLQTSNPDFFVDYMSERGHFSAVRQLKDKYISNYDCTSDFIDRIKQNTI